jgi:predicted metal-dependent peptidase
MDHISKMTDIWFLTEPALFGAFCRHILATNEGMECPVRVGKGRLEYNPSLIQNMPYEEVERRFRVEMIRTLMLHPYSRKPAGCDDSACVKGSDLAISTWNHIPGMVTPSECGFPDGQYYEWYAHKCVGDSPDYSVHQNGDGETDVGGNPNMDLLESDSGDFGMEKDGENNVGSSGNGAQAELWEEDQWMQEGIRQAVEQTTSWGSLPGDLVEQIQAALKPKLDYRKVLSGFRSSVLCSKRRLTRMRPNRRSGFQYMGSIRQLRTNYLVGVDVSGSISEENLQYFFSTINRFFKYGVEKIDVVTFDTKLGEPMTLSKARSKTMVNGRGGTSFRPVVYYMAEHPEYDGLIIFTDGYAPVPEIPARLRGRLLWILRSKKEYEAHRQWMGRSGRVCFIENR